jgi:hypothetical protein
MSDIVSETVASAKDTVVSDPNAVRLPTPDDRIREEQFEMETGAPVVSGDDVVSPTVNLEELEAKLDKDPEAKLSEEERIALAELSVAMRAEPEKPQLKEFEQKSYNIGGNTFSFSEMLADASAYLETDATQLSDNGKQRIVDIYVKSKNKSQANISLRERQDKTAAERRALAEKEMQLKADRTSILRERKRLAELEQRLAAKSKLFRETQDFDVNGEDGKIDVAKLSEITSSRMAAEQLSEVQQAKKQLESDEQKLSGQMTIASVMTFIGAQPQYQTKEPFEVVYDKIQKGQPVDHEDRIKIAEVFGFVDKAAAYNMDIDTVYEVQRRQNSLAVKRTDAQPSSLTSLPEPLKNNPAELIRNYRKKVAMGAIPSGTHTNTINVGGDDKSTALKMIESGRRAGSVQTADREALKKIGW